MNKELIFKLLTLDAIKVAVEKHRVRLYNNTAFDYYELSLYNEDNELYTICVANDPDEGCHMKYWTRTYPMWSTKIDITTSEYEKVKLNLLIIKDYINSLQDKEMTNLINEIINE